MIRHKRILTAWLGAALLAAAVNGSAGAEAVSPGTPATFKPIVIYLDGKRLFPATAPLNLNGNLLLPMRDLLEAQGAKLSWEPTTRTVTASKNGTTLVYRIGEQTAQLNGRTLTLTVPGQLSNGYTLLPLRVISEALGSRVQWDQASLTVTLTTEAAPPKPDDQNGYETSVLYGVNLRSAADSGSESTVLELLPTGSKVHVISVVNALWLQVQAEDGKTGYVSAKPGFTDYKSAALADLQGDAILAEGKKYLGTPYEFGASPDQTKTFDCSSFVKRVFQDTLSIDLPRVSYDQAKTGQEVSLSELRKGDLLFFDARGLDIGHVGIYAGNNQILHTYSKDQGVHIETFSDKWKKRFVTARRVF